MFKLMFTTIFGIFAFISLKTMYNGIADEGPSKKAVRYLYRISMAGLAMTGILWAAILFSLIRLHIFGPSGK